MLFKLLADNLIFSKAFDLEGGLPEKPKGCKNFEKLHGKAAFFGAIHNDIA